MKNRTPFFGTLASIAALFCCVVTVNGALVAHDHFNYTTADGASLTGVTVNGGIGWDEPWQQGHASLPGINVGSPARSLSFSQTPALIIDGSNHVFAEANTANRRNLATPVAANTTYFSLLIRSFINESQTGGGARMRVLFYDDLDASGNMRANVGIDGTSLFVSGNNAHYAPHPDTDATAEDVFEDETTYLLVMKRTGSAISAALIEADGDPATLESEPVWQVSHANITGVNFNSLRIIINGSSTALRVDELKVATTWEGVVSRAIHPPEGLVATAGEGKARLQWSTVENASSYTVYRSMSTDGTYQPVANTRLASFVDVGLEPESNYYYAVTTTDENGLKSDLSNIVSVQPTGTLLSPQADAYVQYGPFSDNGNNNDGTANRLYCINDGNVEGSTRHAYLRFDLSSLEGTVGSAFLRLKVASTGGGGDIHTARAVADDSWGETSITWNNKPDTGSSIASAPSPGEGEWNLLDVTDQVETERAGNQLFSTAITSGGSSLVGYHSREAADANDRPVLMVAMREAPIPGRPTGLSATKDEAGRIQLSWNSQGVPGEFTYRIYRATQPSGPLVQFMDTEQTTFTDEDAVAGQSFFYWVATVNADGYASAPSVFAGLEPPLAKERFDYFDANHLADGSANSGTGWAGGWQALSGGGLHILNRRIDQTAAAASGRAIANPFSLSGPGRYYFAFYASADSNATFSFRLKQALPGPFVRWAFSRNGDGSITIQAGGASQTSVSGVFAADKEYLVVSRFDTNSDTASVKLIDPDDIQNYFNEPAEWDLSASGATGVTINQLDIEAAGGVRMDDVGIAESYTVMLQALDLLEDHDLWAANWPEADLSDPQADFDGDGLTNREERIWGLDPTCPESRNPFVVPLAADGAFQYSRRDPALTGKVFRILTSTNLIDWTEDTGAIQQPTPATGQENVQIVEVTVSSILLTEPHLFVRMMAEKTPEGGPSRLIEHLDAGVSQKLVYYGTSLTAAGAWTVQLQDELESRYGPLISVRNRAQSGRDSRWGLANVEQRVVAETPDTVLIEFSMNDAIQDREISTEQARSNLETMIDVIQSANPNTEVILLTMNCLGGEPAARTPDHPYYRGTLPDHYQVYRDVAESRGLLLIDLYPLWVEWKDSNPDLFDLHVADGVHPDAEACSIVVLPEVKRVLGIGK